MRTERNHNCNTLRPQAEAFTYAADQLVEAISKPTVFLQEIVRKCCNARIDPIRLPPD